MATKLLREEPLLDTQVVVTALSAPLGDAPERAAEAVFGGVAATVGSPFRERPQ